jgi:DNA-binding IscR family transcriptional regulator
MLIKSPEQTSLAAIIRIIDGPIAMLPCVSLYFYERCADCDEQHCHLNGVLVQARDALLGVLEHKTLRDIM